MKNAAPARSRFGGLLTAACSLALGVPLPHPDIFRLGMRRFLLPRFLQERLRGR